VCRELPGVELAGVFDANSTRASKIATEFGTRAFTSAAQLVDDRPDAVCVAVPTREHARIGCLLLNAGFDVLVEKPMAASLQEADTLIASAKNNDRILQIGHLERFNPAVMAVQSIVNRPMFFEVHRLGVFTPRSLDVDVVYDVMIHDLDILLSLVDSPVVDLKAVGIPVMTDKVDIAQARIEFATGTVANVTASRVSTERVRKMRFFQEHEYISLDFSRQDLLRVRVQQPMSPPSAFLPDDGQPEINFEKVPTTPGEPLRAELSSFIECVRTRKAPIVNGSAGRLALELADQVMAGILDHARRVQVGAFSPQEVR
jgi:predicted dehydrogenase